MRFCKIMFLAAFWQISAGAKAREFSPKMPESKVEKIAPGEKLRGAEKGTRRARALLSQLTAKKSRPCAPGKVNARDVSHECAHLPIAWRANFLSNFRPRDAGARWKMLEKGTSAAPRRTKSARGRRTFSNGMDSETSAKSGNIFVARNKFQLDRID